MTIIGPTIESIGPLDVMTRPCHRASVNAPPSGPRDSPGPDDEISSLLERMGQLVLGYPLVRSAMEQPEVAAPWLVLGVVVLLAAVVGGTPLTLGALLFGLPILLGARIAAAGRHRHRSDPGSALRLGLLVVWLVATLGATAAVFWVDAKAGDTGIIRWIGATVVFGVAMAALRLLFRA